MYNSNIYYQEKVKQDKNGNRILTGFRELSSCFAFKVDPVPSPSAVLTITGTSSICTELPLFAPPLDIGMPLLPVESPPTKPSLNSEV